MLNVASCNVRRGVADVSGDFLDCLPILISIIGFLLFTYSFSPFL